MTMGNDLSDQFALDVQSVQRLKYSAANSSQGSLKEASRQFEAIFLQMMLKSMRDASPKSGLLQSHQMDMMRSMQDQQWAQQLAGKGLGLADQLVQQLEGSGLPGTSALPATSGKEDTSTLIAGIPRGTPRLLHDGQRTPGFAPDSSRHDMALSGTPGNSATDNDVAVAPSSARADDGDRPAHVRAFLERLAGPARRAEQASGVPAELILAQAALETGWGQREIPTARGGNSHNLFGIKAGQSWQGATTEITTTEYVNGRPIKVSDRFRVYDSYTEAFADYASLIGGNPRYRGVVAASSPDLAAQALQYGGYATDPRYAEKLQGVMAQLGELDAPRGRDLLAASGDNDNPFGPGAVPSAIF
ncbi:flagellar assembly peptidoglycan hydrolase FlgJ [Salinicola corii]|uniref:Peptidoglycan hydrolase FlgJ n=1 Tax=Salinicola corii TaxID=2606937 RepID=A0A640WFY4_9GAMM|nr:flagellar assembly peptidoglycan hydrolase FlgJ [Salinicola corii]KAA0019188.1 flagellar assembly peptidoglycan hydrolase FlgJ [Salinicola corii]